MNAEQVQREGRPGFTLLELLVVVTIVCLVAATAAVRMSHGYRRAQFRRAAQVLQEVDGYARRLAASRERPLELRIDLSSNRFELTQAGSRQELVRRWTVASPLSLAAAATRREDRRTGEVVVRFDRRGRSDTYAVKIASPGGGERWLLFAGLTGQPLEDIPLRGVEERLRALAKNLLNAD